MAKDKYYLVRRAVALSSSCPPDLLAELARDPYKIVRLDVAENRSCPSHVFATLVRDSCEAVRLAAAKNPSCSPEAIASLAVNRLLVPDDASIPTSELYCPPCSPLALNAGESLVGYLEHLAVLHDKGALDDKEFAAAKRRLFADGEKPLG